MSGNTQWYWEFNEFFSEGRHYSISVSAAFGSDPDHFTADGQTGKERHEQSGGSALPVN